MGHDVSALVLEHDRTFSALERYIGLFISERCSFLLIGFGGACILRPAAPTLRKSAHPLQRSGVVLRGGLFEQRPRGNIVLGPADALRNHLSELILRLCRVRLRRFRKRGSRLNGIGRGAVALVEGREIGGAAGIASRGGALERSEGRRV